MNAIVKAIVDTKVRIDGWMNIITGMGTAVDKRMGACVSWQRMSETELEQMYAADDMAAKVVDMPIDDAFREGYELTGLEDDEQDRLEDMAEELLVDQRVIEAAKCAAIYGGAGIFKATDDLADLAQPLPDGQEIKALTVFHAFELYMMPDQVEADIRNPHFGEPKQYTLRPRNSAYMTNISNFPVVDASRIVRFDGIWVPRSIRVMMNFWGDSILNRVNNAIRNYNISHDAAAATLQDFSISVFKMKNLAELIGAEGDKAVMARLAIVNMSKSINRSVIIDADGEDFDHKTRSVMGVPEILTKVEGRLVSATRMPHTVLFGNSPNGGGINQTGSHEQSNWYDYVASYQTGYLKPRLLEIYRHLAVLAGIDPEKVDITFKPLWQETDKEIADRKYVNAQADALYVTGGVLTPEEIAIARFGSDDGDYGSEISIDPKTREEPPLPKPGTPEAIKLQAQAAAVAAATPKPPAGTPGALPQNPPPAPQQTATPPPKT